MFRKIYTFLSKLKWWQLVVLTTSLTIIGFLLYKLMLWLLPLFAMIFGLVYIYTDGEVFTIFWQKYKAQTPGYKENHIVNNFYNWLTEEGVTELPISTSQFLQGVEYYPNDGIYYVHLNERISSETLDSFTMKARQKVKLISFGSQDCIISLVEKEPFLATKVRLLPSTEAILQNTVKEEDF